MGLPCRVLRLWLTPEPPPGLCHGDGGRSLTADSGSLAAHPQDRASGCPGATDEMIPEAPALGGLAIKPNKAQGAPQEAHRGAHSNWPWASASPGAVDYASAAGRGPGRVKTLREARWEQLASCISHERPC